MSTTAEPAAAAEGGQLLIDGLPLADRRAGVQGSITIPGRLYDELALGTRLRVVMELDVVSRTDRKKRNQFGDDEAHRVLGVSIHAARSMKVIPITDDAPLASVDGEDEPEPPKRRGGKAAERRERERGLRGVPEPDAAEPPISAEVGGGAE